MKMQVAARRHRNPAGLEREELAPADGDLRIVDGIAEHAARQRDFTGAERALSADRTGERPFAQRSSPAARTSAGKLTLSPPTKVSVTSALPPAATVSARSIAMTCAPPGANEVVPPGATA